MRGRRIQGTRIERHRVLETDAMVDARKQTAEHKQILSLCGRGLVVHVEALHSPTKGTAGRFELKYCDDVGRSCLALLPSRKGLEVGKVKDLKLGERCRRAT